MKKHHKVPSLVDRVYNILGKKLKKHAVFSPIHNYEPETFKPHICVGKIKSVQKGHYFLILLRSNSLIQFFWNLCWK